MPRINMRINARRAATVGLASFATLTLIPLLAQAKPSERAFLLLAAVPAAALFGYLAGYAAATTTGATMGFVTHLNATQLRAAQQDVKARAAQLQAAQRSAATTAQPGTPVIRLVSEPIPRPGTGSPLGSGHLAALARPPADQPAGQHRDGFHRVPAPTREASTEAAPSGPSGSNPHLTLIVTQHPTS